MTVVNNIRWLLILLVLIPLQSGAETVFDHLDTGFALQGLHATLECEKCHVGGVYDELPTACADCHNGTITIDQPSTHIPVSAPCDNCHTPEGFSLSSNTLFNHSVVAGTECSSCHNSVNASGKPANHIDTRSDCGLCHSTNTWLTGNFDHTTQDTSTCARSGCHHSGNKPPSHPKTTDSCEFCHDFSAWLPYLQPLNHSQVIGSCGGFGCHDGSSNGNSKPAAHLPSDNLCENCHMTSTWVDLIRPLDHSGFFLTSCLSFGCHDPNVQPATHPRTTNTCELCHSGGQWIPLRMPFPHEQTTDQCVNCHNGNIATGKTPLHPVTSDDCSLCHQTGTVFLRPSAPFLHDGVIQPNCVSSGCHSAQDKSPLHPPTNDSCELCHNTTAWADVSVSAHTYTTGCANVGCHNQPANHPLTSPSCEACHTYPLWTDLNFDHAFANGACNSAGCHDGVSIRTFKGATHPVTTNACEFCHYNTAWRPVIVPFAHDQTSAACQSCHNGIIAVDKSGAHPAATDLCVLCHITTTFTTTFVVPFGHDQTSATCVTCHNNVITQGKLANHPPASDVCEDCHVVTGWLSVTIDHNAAANQINCGRSGCHDGLSGNTTGKGASHPLTSNTCHLCHSFNQGWFNILLPFDHTQVINIASTCKGSGCHTTAEQGNHGNCGVTDQDCVLCHNTNGWTSNPDSTLCGSGTGGGSAPTAVINGPFSGTCNVVYTFDGLASTDPDNDPLTYSWIGTAIASGPTVTQTFTTSGSYTITLTVNDGQQDSLPVNHTITISGGMGCGM